MTIEELFRQRLPLSFQARPDWVRKLGAVLQFHITGEGGGDWAVDCTKPESPVAAGTHPDARCTITCAADDFIALVQRKWTPQQALTAGRLAVKGDMTVAVQFPLLFARPGDYPGP